MPVRACQLGSSATGPIRVTPYVCWLSTKTCASVYPLSTRFGREQPTLGQGRMHALDHMIIQGGGGRRLDIDNHMGSLGLTRFREMDLVADPLHLTLYAVSGLRIIREAMSAAGDGTSFTSCQLRVPLTSMYCSAQTRRRVCTAGTSCNQDCSIAASIAWSSR